MAAGTMAPGVRRVLGAPHGRRFGRPGERVVTRQASPEEILLADMIEYRRRHCVPHQAVGHREPAPVPVRKQPIPDPLPETRKRGAHRKPRRKGGWKLVSYALAASAGLLVGHLAPWVSLT